MVFDVGFPHDPLNCVIVNAVKEQDPILALRYFAVRGFIQHTEIPETGRAMSVRGGRMYWNRLVRAGWERVELKDYG
jgi:hypothetical protein